MKNVEPKSQNVEPRLKSLRNRNVPPVGKLEPPDESNSEVVKPLRYFVFLFSVNNYVSYFCISFSQRSQIPVAKANRTTLQIHRTVNTDERPHGCNICKMQFTRKFNLNMHVKMVHKNQRPHGCNICKKRFKALSTLNAHLLLHSGEKPHGCNMCKKQFRQISTLKNMCCWSTQTSASMNAQFARRVSP